MAKKTKRKVNILLAYLLIVVMLAASIPMGLAWYSDNTRSNANIVGTVQGNYFEGGDGSQSDPFIIARPIQLYYFAWLQNLGNFNTLDEDGNVKQVYFKIKVADDDGVGNNTLDMTGIELPPIGTVEHPFIGSFDGNGAIITNLTVLADMNDSQGGYYHPPTIVNDDFGVQIVGFFGVVGSTNGNTVTIDGENYAYNSSVVSVNNVILNNVMIDSVRPLENQTLVGIVAGYVNGKVTNVAVGRATVAIENGINTLNVGTSNYSDYSTIGYCTEQFKDSLSVFNVKIAAPSAEAIDPSMGDDSNADANWGGSIDMKTMYNNLNGIYKLAYNPSYVTRVDKTLDYTNLDASGNPTITSRDMASATEPGFKIYDSSDIGNFVFSTRTDNGTQYLYLYGEDTYTKSQATTVNTETRRYEDVTLIQDGDFYLDVVGSGSIASSTDTTTAVSWNISNTTGGFYLSTTVGGTVYYLNRNGATQLTTSTSTNNRTVWNQENGAFYCSVDNVKYYIDRYNESWQLSTLGQNTYIYYKISSGTNYLNLNANRNGLARGTAQNAMSWQFSNGTPGGYLYTTVDSVIYYIDPTITGRFNTPAISVQTSPQNSWSYNSNNQYLYYTGGTNNSTVYLNYRNSWALSNNAQALTFTEQIETIDIPIEDVAKAQELNNTLRIQSTTTNEDANIETPDTWFPLAMESGENGVLSVTDKNTGYVVSGSDFKNTAYPRQSGNIRVSQYAKNGNISGSLTNNNLNHTAVYSISYLNGATFKTIGSTKAATDTFGFERYASSADKLNEILSARTGNNNTVDTNVYGLHFMNAVIETDLTKGNFVTIPQATINKGGNEPEIIANYQVPRNAITFNLAKAGFINFFAGTYFTGNSSFFSLYDIEREGGTLISIKEIKNVYGVVDGNNKIVKSYPYIYEYADNTYSVEGYNSTKLTDEGYKVVFNTNWLTSPTGFQNSRIYYFEIPVNEGEYALGSVAGKDGAYLIYLDLAANAQEVQKITTTEYVMTTKSTYEYPLGVQFVDVDSLSIDGFDEKYNSAAIRIESIGAITIERNGDNIVISTPQGDSPPTFVPTFVGDGLTMTNGPNQLTPRPLYQITVLERRETVRNINMITLEEVITVTTTTQTTVSMENEDQEVVISVTVTQTIQTIRIDKAGVASEPEVQEVANAEQFELPEGIEIIVTAHGLTSNIDASLNVGDTALKYDVSSEKTEDGKYDISITDYEIMLDISDAELGEELDVSIDENADYVITVEKNIVTDDNQAA